MLNLPKCWDSCLNFIKNEICIIPDSPPPDKQKTKVNWFVGEQPLKLK